MAIIKKLVSETPTSRRYEFRDDAAGNKLVSISDEAVLTPEQEREQSLRSKAAGALQANATFLALASPTNAQTLAQVQRLTRQNNALIRLMLGLLDTDDA